MIGCKFIEEITYSNNSTPKCFSCLANRLLREAAIHFTVQVGGECLIGQTGRLAEKGFYIYPENHSFRTRQ